MNTLIDNILPMYERVIHIAFGCGCVQSFAPDQVSMIKCPVHGDGMLSTTEELVPKQRSVA